MSLFSLEKPVLAAAVGNDGYADPFPVAPWTNALIGGAVAVQVDAGVDLAAAKGHADEGAVCSFGHVLSWRRVSFIDMLQ